MLCARIELPSNHVNPLAGPLYAFALLLVGAGIVKVTDPAPTQGALAAIRLPNSRLTVRALGVAELTVAAVVLGVGDTSAALALGGLYAGFAAFVAYALRSGTPVASCGCFGREDTPPTTAHLTVTLLGAATGGAAAVGAPGPMWNAVTSTPWAGVPFLAATATLAYLLLVSLTVLARVQRSAVAAASTNSSSGSRSRAVGAQS